MADNVISSISDFLERFNPRTFQSDGQAAQYPFNRAKPGRFGGGTQYHRLHADYDEANEHLRSGDIDAPTQKFVKMMDDSAVNLDSDIIVSQTVGPDAFGLTPETMGLEDGGIEDFTGKLIADRGYRAANIGTPLSHGPGKITMSMPCPRAPRSSSRPGHPTTEASSWTGTRNCASPRSSRTAVVATTPWLWPPPGRLVLLRSLLTGDPVVWA